MTTTRAKVFEILEQVASVEDILRWVLEAQGAARMPDGPHDGTVENSESVLSVTCPNCAKWVDIPVCRLEDLHSEMAETCPECECDIVLAVTEAGVKRQAYQLAYVACRIFAMLNSIVHGDVQSGELELDWARDTLCAVISSEDAVWDEAMADHASLVVGSGVRIVQRAQDVSG